MDQWPRAVIVLHACLPEGTRFRSLCQYVSMKEAQRQKRASEVVWAFLEVYIKQWFSAKGVDPHRIQIERLERDS